VKREQRDVRRNKRKIYNHITRERGISEMTGVKKHGQEGIYRLSGERGGGGVGKKKTKWVQELGKGTQQGEVKRRMRANGQPW